MSKVEKIKAYLERRIAEIRDISQGYIADKQMSTEYLLLHELLSFIDSLEEEPISNDLEEAANSCSSCIYLEEVLSDDDKEVLKERLVNTFKAGAQWQKENLWKPADGDDLPEIDREVIVLLNNGRVAFGHRPPEYWDGKDIITGKVTRNYPKTYDKGGWNQPAVVWWLDVELPKEEG